MDMRVRRRTRYFYQPSSHKNEKNWIPLPKQSPTGYWEEWFVYKWHPFELGRVNTGAESKLQIERRYATPAETFSKIRESTTFTDYGDNQHLIGLVHFSEEHTPRHYYHMLVLLDRETFRPVRYSATFYFEKLTIEFCIGMTTLGKNNETYGFWISRFDRDPLYIEIHKADIPFVYEI